MSKFKLSVLIIFLVVLTFLMTPIEINNNGWSNALDLIKSGFTPDLSVLPKALEAGFITLMYASASIGLAILISLILSFFAAGILTSNKFIRQTIKQSFIVSRSIHELIWALFFVTVIGLKPMTAILALTIPYSGMLGKVFTDIFEQAPKKNIKAVSKAGASPLQLVCFGYIPETLPQLVSYSIYRFECAIRSSTIMGFVGITGIGLKIQLTLNDLKFHEMFTYVYILIAMIVIVELWSNKYRNGKLKQVSPYVVTVLFISSWAFILFYEGALYDAIISQKNLGFLLQFLKDLVGIGNDSIAYLNFGEITTVLKLALQTIQMSIVAIALAIIFMMISIVPSTKRLSHPVLYYLSRGILIFTRAVPELIWALILVFIFKPGIWVGALALGIHNYGILTKLCSETIEGLPNEPFVSMKNTGSSYMQILIFGIIPSTIQRFISYSLYRFEIIMRTTIVVGMAGTAGLGYYFKLHFSWFHYTHITLIIIVYLILVKLTDWLSHKLNRIYAF